MPHLDEPRVDISPKDIDDALRHPSSFAYRGDREMFETWSLGPVILTRDSRLLDQSNAAALKAHLASDPSLDEDYEITNCGHWAVGWVEHLSFRAIEADGTPSRIFRVLKAWFNALESYPVADSSDYSEREYEATLRNIEQAGRRMVKDDAPDDWASQCFGWFWDHDQGAVENCDDQGGYPSDDQMHAALEALELFAEEG